MTELLFGPTPHDEAIAFLQGKPVLSKAVFDGLLPELKALAFTISGIEDMAVLQSVQEQLAKLPAGVPWDKVKKGLVETLHPYLDDSESGKKRAEARAELLLRTHGFQAYQTASYRVMDQQRDVFPYWQYQSMGDGHVRPAHAALNNIVLPCDHEFWKTHFPPWQFNCRCQVIPLSEDDYGDIKKADEARDLDHKHILNEDALKLLTEKRILVRNGVAFNVSTDAEKGKEGAYQWHPGNLRPDLAKLQAHYAPSVWNKFVAFAQGQQLPGGVSLYGWLKGAPLSPVAPPIAPKPKPKLPPKAKAAPVAVPAPAPVAPPVVAPPPAPVAPPPAPPRRKLKVTLIEPPSSPAPAQPSLPAQDTWPDLAKLEKVKALGGSTGAELMRDPASGKLFVLKRGNSPEHVREEFAADEAYRALGAAVPRAKLYESGGQPVKLAEHIEGEQLGAWLKKATPEQAAALRGKVHEHFAADALLGNWDVAGMGMDNILVDKAGTPWRIDNGGSLRFRAQGTKKTADEWNAFPEELWTLRDPKLNPQTAKLFGDLDIFAIGKQTAAIDEKKLFAAVPKELHETLSARLANLQDMGRKAVEMKADKWKAAYTDDLTREMMGLRKTGLIKDLPAHLIGKPGDVSLVDAEGNAFDHLRSQGKKGAAAGGTDGFYETFLNAAKTINAHHAKGDVAYNQGKIDAAVKQKGTLTILTKSPDKELKEMAKHYLGLLDGLQKAVGNKALKAPTVAPFVKPDAKVEVASQSLVERLAAHMKERGGDWAHIEAWASGQAGSSRSQASTAYKYFLFEQLEGAKAEDFYLQPNKAAYAKVVPAAERESYRKSMLAHHAFIQETLAHVAFATNDQERRRVRLLRTESAKSAVPFAVGEKGQYQRGVNESGSLFRPVFSGARTITNVPHSRVTSLYFLERRPGSGGTFLLGDNENEATYIGWGLDTHHASDNYFKANPGTDSTKWEI